ncbi:LuxR family transcriptional regulator [Aliiruegeria haliotis]|uniref:LuxR family transcriptional regulator n=2 Tax=Aliiruegeria haliotis TaxID=1280846 RepID=A0A2T0RUM3_9RHOB|nr:LuxR family transcriptional regulator [Aliiruegeria haliotis]
MLAPAGFHVAVRVGFAFPEYEWNTLPRAWVCVYTRDALMLYDPVTRWIYENTGSVRWSEIGLDDPRNVLALAANHGLTFGAAICVVDENEPGIRTFGTFARSDTDFTDEEIATLTAHLARLHRQEPIALILTDAEIETLRMLRDGLLTKQIAHELEISESAVKQRLKSVKTKLDARNTIHAVTIAERRGLFRMA